MSSILMIIHFLEDLCKQPFDNIGNINDTSKALET